MISFGIRDHSKIKIAHFIGFLTPSYSYVPNKRTHTNLNFGEIFVPIRTLFGAIRLIISKNFQANMHQYIPTRKCVRVGVFMTHRTCAITLKFCNRIMKKYPKLLRNEKKESKIFQKKIIKHITN